MRPQSAQPQKQVAMHPVGNAVAIVTTPQAMEK
jgi:hypothetical protein